MNTPALGNEGRARWSLRLLGDFQLSERASGEKVALPGKRERVLLAYLALSPNGRQPRRKLVTLLWGEAADETTLDNLRTSVFNLRKALGDTEHQIIASEDRDIVLGVSAFEVDVLEFRRFAAGSTVAELEDAARLYAGDVLDGLSIESEEFESWRRAEAGRFKDQAIDALTRLMTKLAGSGESERAIEIGTRILQLEPLHEGAVRRLMRLYGESGRRGAAIQVYRNLADALKTELNAQPEAETRAVFAEISHGSEEQTESPAAAEAKPPSPSLSLARPPSGTPPRPAPAPALAASAPRPATSPRLGWILGGGLTAVMALFLLLQFVPSTGTSVRQASTIPAGAIAIAVLPFVNLSGDTAQEFFSDGITEEITSALAKVPDLRVVGRTSAFQFKGQNRDLRAIGQSLAATHLIEGSVRKEGSRVRITVQLIKSDDGTHIWSENYDRELTGIFAIQEDIARALTASVRMPLGLKPGENLVNNRGLDPESYEQFLRAKALVRGRGLEGLTDAAALLEPLVARNPDFAPAWAQLSLIYQRMPGQTFRPGRATAEETRRAADEWLPKAEAAAKRAIALDASLPDGYSSLGLTMAFRGRLLQADELFNKALALDALYPEALHSYANLLGALGHSEKALARREQVRSIEPLVPVYGANREVLLLQTGQTDTAIASMKARRPSIAPILVAMMDAAEGRYAEAADELRATPQVPFYPGEMVEAAVRILRTAPTRAVSPQSLPRLTFDLNFVYLHVGAPERILEPFEDGVAAGFLPPSEVNSIWLTSYAPARKLERFKAFARSYGLAEYWRAKGWPELCRPTTGDDFACE